MLKMIGKYLRKYKTYLGVYVILAIVSLGIAIYKPLVYGNFIDSIILGMGKINSFSWAKVLIFISIFNIIINYISILFMLKFQTKMSFDVELAMIQHIQKLPIQLIKKYDSAYLNTRINNDSNEIVGFTLNNITTIFSETILIVTILYLTLQINQVIFLVELSFIPVYVLLYTFMRKPIYKRSASYKEEQNRLFNRINEQFRLINEIKTEATFHKNTQVMLKSFSGFMGKLVSYSRITVLFSSLDSMIGVFFQVVTLLVCVNELYRKNMTIGQFTILNTYFSLLIEGVKYYLELGKSYQSVKVSVKRMEELDHLQEEQNGTLQIDSVDTIRVNNISFRYSEEEKQILKDFTYEFKKSRIYMIKGSNGIGKSTFVNILTGIIRENVEGDIYYNRNKVEEIDMYQVRRDKIAIISQNILYPNDLVKNIFHDNMEDVGKEQLEERMKEHKLEFVYNKDNFDILEKNCLELSGGEKQRVELMKALLKDPDVLIMDEPTSAMDKISIEKLIKALNTIKKDRIVLIVTHNERLEAASDEVIVFE